MFVPSAFRKILQQEGVEKLVLRRDIFQHCLVLFPLDVWNGQVDAIAARTSLFDRKGREALRQFVADAEVIAPDSGGRILLPKRYMEEAGIRNEVRFIGMDNTIEIWNREAADAISANVADLGDTLEAMMMP